MLWVFIKKEAKLSLNYHQISPNTHLISSAVHTCTLQVPDTLAVLLTHFQKCGSTKKNYFYHVQYIPTAVKHSTHSQKVLP